MRGVLGLGLLLALTGAGCVSSENVRPKGLAGQRLLSLPQGADVVQLDVALVERRLGDAFLNKELWASTDEQAAGIDQVALLENNGFRVGQVIGSLPGDLQQMLKNDRYRLLGKQYYMRAGASLPLPLGLAVPTATFEVKHDDRCQEVTEDQVQFELLVEPTLTADGKTRLRFTPQAKYGEAVPSIEAAPDNGEWVFQVKKQCHSYPELSWEVTLAPNENLVIGTHLGRPQALGYQAFVNEEGATPVQRLLVLRTNRAAPAEAGGEVPTVAGQALQSGKR